MFLSLVKNLQRTYYKDPLKYLELTFLSLMLLSLPSLEAPKKYFPDFISSDIPLPSILKKNKRSLETLGLDFFKLHRIRFLKCCLRWNPSQCRMGRV